MATVRQNRRTQLAEKLRDVFELSNINEVVAGKTPFSIDFGRKRKYSLSFQKCPVGCSDQSVSCVHSALCMR